VQPIYLTILIILLMNNRTGGIERYAVEPFKSPQDCETALAMFSKQKDPPGYTARMGCITPGGVTI
jgi:hypothetical protein